MEMELKRLIQKSKTFLNKTHHKLKSFLSNSYKKLPKSSSLNPLSSNIVHRNAPQSDQHCLEQLDESDKKSTSKREEDTNNSVSISPREMGKSYEEGKGVSHYEEGKGETPKMLSHKMKELEMMDLNDVNQMMDIEEVMYYYSRIKSHVYIEIVDKFFMDMYKEFLVPKPSASASSSSRRLGPLKL